MQSLTEHNRNSSVQHNMTTPPVIDKKRILVIDDDVLLTQIMKLNLDATGDYEVRIENDSLHALETAQQFHPDLILLDYIMPIMDGGDVSLKLYNDPLLRRVPVIMITALVSSRDATEDGTVHRGGHLMFAKPIRFEKLKHCIEQQLALAS
jgi:CheY-like chemotaxis protein